MFPQENVDGQKGEEWTEEQSNDTISPHWNTKWESDVNYVVEGMKRVHISTYTMAELKAADGEERTACQSHTRN